MGEESYAPSVHTPVLPKSTQVPRFNISETIEEILEASCPGYLLFANRRGRSAWALRLGSERSTLTVENLSFSYAALEFGEREELLEEARNKKRKEV